MPYIEEERARALTSGRSAADLGGLTVGDITWAHSENIARYVEDRGLSYQTIAEVRASLHGALAEFDRRVAAPYEAAKAEERGRVDPFKPLRQKVKARIAR